MAPWRWCVSTAALALLLLLAPVLPAAAQPAPPQPFAPDWGMLAGWNVFAAKGCGKCHAIRGAGGVTGPDLGRIDTGKSFFELGAAVWNHLPRMGERMREAGIERPRMTSLEASNLIAFLFTAQYFDDTGDARRGETLFDVKRCSTCHAVGGRGRNIGPALDGLKQANSPVLVAAAMWNHAPDMIAAFRETETPRPTFDGKELVDLIAYIKAAAKDSGNPTQQVIPGTPERGRALFADKKCGACHAVAGKGPRVGPDLGRPALHGSLTDFAAGMWNHAPAMTARMKERKIEVPKLTGQDMADIVAYLYTARYFEASPSPRRGPQILQSKGCMTCHAINGKGGKAGGDFARSGVVGSPGALVAAMWNHSRLMEAEAEKRRVPWPELSGAELADISAYFVTLSRNPGKPTAR